MRIVNRKEFMELPENTAYCEYERYTLSPLRVKLYNAGGSNTDFVYTELIELPVNNHKEYVEMFQRLEQPNETTHLLSGDINMDVVGYGVQYYAVFDNDDVRTIINILTKCIQ